MAIDYGQKDWPGLQSETLMGERILPVCSPSFFRPSAGNADVQCLENQTLIHCSFRPREWDDWLEEAGVKRKPGFKEHHMSTREATLEAAAAGLGIALGHSPFVNEEIARGRLIAPFGRAHQTANAYKQVTTVEKLRLPRVEAFNHWLREEAQ